MIANHTDGEVDVVITPSQGKPQPYTLAPKDVLPVPAVGKVQISFEEGGAQRQQSLDVNSAYYFARQEGKLGLHRIRFADQPRPDDGPPDEAGEAASRRPIAAPQGGVLGFYRMGIIPVMILVDDEQVHVRRVWQERLRERLERASDVFERHCRIRFRAVKSGTWDSDDKIRQFNDSLREFELEVVPDPAALAIGFTSQYQLPTRGRSHLGGTRGPLCRHVLIREGTGQLTEAEHMEVLLHELGHVLGAAHCDDPDSVMRPRLGDGRARARSFRIGFDPANTLIMYLVASELRTGAVSRFGQLSRDTKRQLRSIYTTMSEALPGDPAAEGSLRLLDDATLARPAPISPPASLVKAARAVVRGITEAAQENQERPAVGLENSGRGGRLTGDRLTEHYFRRAAAAARSAPPESAAKGYLLGLAIGLDDSSLLRSDRMTGPLCRQVESDEERARRIAVLGVPTMRGRRDLAQAFVTSCGLTALLGPEAAQAIGRLKELNDSKQDQGFSFVDLLAHTSGVAFAERVRSGSLGLGALAESFRVEDFLPGVHDLDEGLPWKSFFLRYGSLQDDRFHHREAAIRQRILSLPGYAKATAEDDPDE